MVPALRQFLILSILAGVGGGSKKTPEPTPAPKATTTALPAAAAQAAVDMGGDGKLDPNDPKHGTRKLMGLDAPVYVDGAQVAVFRAGEMPALQAIQLEGAGK